MLVKNENIRLAVYMDFFHHHYHWRYKNTTLLILSAAVFLIFADSPAVKFGIERLGEWGYVGAVFAGILSVITFTVAPALVVIYYLSEKLNLLELCLLAGFGSVIGDFIIFNFFKDKVFIELKPILDKLAKRPVMHIFHSPYFTWLTPVVGAIILASPLPDEFGVTLLSASKLKEWHFIILSFVLNSIGILIIIKGAHLILE